MWGRAKLQAEDGYVATAEATPTAWQAGSPASWGRSAAGTGPETRHPETSPTVRPLRWDRTVSTWDFEVKPPGSQRVHALGRGPALSRAAPALERPLPRAWTTASSRVSRWKAAAFEGQWPGRPSPLLRRVRNDNPEPQWAVLRALTPTPGSLQTLKDLGQTDSSPSPSLG